MTSITLPDDWWPEWLQDLASEDPLAADPVIVAAIEGTSASYERYRQLFTALVPPDKVDSLLETSGVIGYDVSTSGPHPDYTPNTGEFSPRFWIAAGTAVRRGLEPLIVSWKSGNTTFLWPDQGFLMTYGLIPRFTGEATHWDDLEAPRYDVVVAEPLSKYDFSRVTGGVVRIAREYLEDYATIRKRALVQVYYAERRGRLTAEIDGILAGEDYRELRLKGRLVILILVEDGDVLARIWGVRLLMRPKSAPISAGRWDYGKLAWPGLSDSFDRDRAQRSMPGEKVFVHDTVLDAYEGRSEFRVHPETGSVSHGNQWSVPSRRIGRDLLAVELKGLYEGNRPETVRQWHAHATEPRADPFATQSNVGTRARRIVYALADLGQAIALIGTGFTTMDVSGTDVVGLDREALDYSGWWTAQHVEPIGRRIPLNLTERQFLARCSELYRLVAEGPLQAHVRRLLTALGIPAADTKKWASLKLLDLVLQLARMSERTGLALDSAPELYRRYQEEGQDSAKLTNPATRLFALNDLRQLSDHRSEAGATQKLEKALTAFGLRGNQLKSGWGLGLDAVYDGLAVTLEDITHRLTASLL